MNEPAISVIIPVYNMKDYLQPCMDSVLVQTLRDIEVICVDDGSTDGTLELLRQYEKQDSRVRLISEENGGAGKARNTGMEIACGKTMIFLDADDFYEPDMLQKAFDKLNQTQAQIVVFDSDLYFDDVKKYSYATHIRWDVIPPYEPFDRRAVTTNQFRVFIGWAWDKLFDATFIKDNGLLFQEQRTTNDMYFVFAALIIAERIAVVREKLAHHRKNVSTSLSNTREESWYCFHDALIKVKQYLIEKELYHEMKQDYVNYALHASLWNLGTLKKEAQRDLFEKLKKDWLAEFDILGNEEEYFYEKNDYRSLLRMRSLAYEQYYHV